MDNFKKFRHEVISSVLLQMVENSGRTSLTDFVFWLENWGLIKFEEKEMVRIYRTLPEKIRKYSSVSPNGYTVED